MSYLLAYIFPFSYFFLLPFPFLHKKIFVVFPGMPAGMESWAGQEASTPAQGTTATSLETKYR